MRRHSSINWFILLFKKRLQHIQIKGQWLNFDLKKALIRICFFDDVMHGVNLAMHLTPFMLFGKCLQYALRSLACNRN